MSHLDEELARVASEDEEAPAAVLPAKPPPRRNVGLLVALLVVGAGLVGLVFSFKEAAVYAKSVDQLMADKARLGGRPVRVEGDLVKGTLKHQDTPCEHRFRMSSNGVELPVRYGQCVIPDTFRDLPDMDVKVTVEGKLGADGQFEATQLMAKCPSKYEMREKSSQGEKAPHTSMLPRALSRAAARTGAPPTPPRAAPRTPSPGAPRPPPAPAPDPDPCRSPWW